MPSNIEIKARVRNFDEMRQRADKLSDMPLQVIQQEDTFFNTEMGRLKLRILEVERAQLI
ncbi:MAG: CYTH domain-containing protein [Anaerolineales bacterium]